MCVCVCVYVCARACQQCKRKDRLIAAFEFQEKNHNFDSFGFRVNSGQKYQHQISAPASALWRISKQTREHKAKHRPGEKKKQHTSAQNSYAKGRGFLTGWLRSSEQRGRLHSCTNHSPVISRTTRETCIHAPPI